MADISNATNCIKVKGVFDKYNKYCTITNIAEVKVYLVINGC